jgi:GntR family transcriptional regulator, carbon starvation induced regulator
METKTLTYQCFEHIRRKIIAGECLPGEKLAVVALAKEIQVGPTPVREALSRLTQTGLVEAFENQGFAVKSLTAEELRDLYNTFLQIENLAIAQAMDRGDEEWESQIVAALYQLSLVENTSISLKQYPLWAERNARFHAALVNGAKSPCLLNIRNQLFMQFDRYFRLALSTNSEPIEVDYSEHKALAEAALKRDKTQMYRLLEEQSKRGLEEMITKLKLKKIVP